MKKQLLCIMLLISSCCITIEANAQIPIIGKLFQKNKIKPKFKYKKVEGSDYIFSIHTEFGDIEFMLFDQTPYHKANFINLVKHHYFNGMSFHRVLDNFVVQGGDPYTKMKSKRDSIGHGGPQYTVPSEIDMRFKHERGIIGAARQADGINPKRASSGSQFYILQRDKAEHLDGGYTVFGKVLRGMDVVDKIAKAKVGKTGIPLDDIKFKISYKVLTIEEIKNRYKDKYKNI